MKTWNWKSGADKSDVKKHLAALNAAIKYYEHRNNTDRVVEFTEERDSLIRFYKLK